MFKFNEVTSWHFNSEALEFIVLYKNTTTTLVRMEIH
jgi:hypothetical protein